MRSDSAQIFKRPEAVDKYVDEVYAPGSYSSSVNARQRAYLRRLIRREFPTQRPVQHDFACGTGRSIRLLQGVVRAAHGYDTSAAMLAKARESGVPATLHEVAETGPVPAPAASDGPALVTMFRLLLNVPEPVRDRALEFAASVLPTRQAGVLLIENHGNRQSLRHLSAGRRADDPWFSELSHDEIRALLARHGFELIGARAFALCPAGAYRRGYLRPLAKLVDAVAPRIPLLWRWGTDVVYVARRVPAS